MGKKDQDKELKKHAATIHCSNTLSLLQRKISNALLYHAYKELMTKEEHEVSIKQLCYLIGYQGHNHGAIREALKGLITTLIEWNVMNEELGMENWTASAILASVSLEGPICYYAYSPRMKMLLHSPTIFGKIDLVIQSRFRSSYGLALYENCNRYKGLPFTKWFEIDLFKKLMGVPADKYNVFRDLKRRVIDQAVMEVNTYSDLMVAAEYSKERRKIIKIRFSLKERIKKMRLGATNHEKEIRESLAGTYSLTVEQINEVLSTYELPLIAEKIKGIESSYAFKQKKIQNLAGYLMSALKHDYQMKISASLDDRVIELDDLKKEIEVIQQEYNQYREKAINEMISSLDEKEKALFMESFFEVAKPMIDTILVLQHKKYNRETIFKSPQIQAMLRQHALREFSFFSLISIEEFIFEKVPEKVDVWQRLKSLDPEHPLLKMGAE